MPDVTGVQQQEHNKVCQDLDDLVLEYIALVNEHLTAWTRISTRFQKGHELLSQAKYIMGPRNVSADCYDHRMKALRGVLIKDRMTEIEIRDLRAEEVERQRLQEAQEEESKKAAEKDSDSHRRQRSEAGYDDQEQEPGGSGLRRRGGGVGSEDASSSVVTTAGMATIDSTSSGTTAAGSADDEATKTKRKKKERNPDPLLWFGVFVPASLRSAQSVFQQGLQDVVEMATIRQRLTELEGRMVVLREAKAAGTKELEADLSGMKL